MLKLESAMNRTFTRPVPAPPAPDFLKRNRRAVRNLSKAKSVKQPHPPPRPTPQQLTKNRPAPALVTEDSPMDATVVISRSYLDQLLRTSLSKTLDPTQDSSKPDQWSSGPHLLPPHNQYSQADQLSSAPHPLPPHNQYSQSQGQPVPVLSHHHTRAQGSEISGVRVPQDAKVSVPQSRNETQASPEDYFPFGRPGCGAPLRSNTGQVMADLRQHAQLQTHATQDITVLHQKKREPPDMLPPAVHAAQHLVQDSAPMPTSERGVLLTRDREVMDSVELVSPRFARGAGPHINQYVLKEKEEKRRKELEHVEYLKAQIAAKREAKRVEREKAEKAEREAEARFLRERQKLQEEEEREAEKARRKKEEAKRRQELIQEAIDKAAEAAVRERERIKVHGKGSDATGKSQFNDPTYSKSSPPHTSHHGVSFDPRHSQRTFGHRSVEGVAADMRSPSMLKLKDKEDTPPKQQANRQRRGSRIPVRNKGLTPQHTQTSTPTGGRQVQQAKRSTPSTRQSHTPTGRRRRQAQGLRQPNAVQHQVQTRLTRAVSPPVPALAKKLKGEGVLEQTNTLQNGRQPPRAQHASNVQPVQVAIVDHKGLGQHAEQRQAIPAAGTMAQRVQSPPVPALAKRLKYGVTGGSRNQASLPQHTAHQHPTKVSSPPLKLPPVQTAIQHGTVKSPPVHESITLPPLVQAQGQILPTEQQESFQGLTTQAVPTQDIMKELLQLRKGILSHRSTLDRNLATLLH